MPTDDLTPALLASYDRDGGINHLDGANLPSQDVIGELARDFMHVLFPGFFESTVLTRQDAPVWLAGKLAKIEKRLLTEVGKCLHFARDPDPKKQARLLVATALARLPEVRRTVQTDVAAAYAGDPAAGSLEEIILAYPCVLAISLQRVAHEFFRAGVPLLPRLLTEYAHERTGIDLHPGAQIGTHFFIDHGTGDVVGETARIGHHFKLYQGVTLGAKSLATDATGEVVRGTKRHPDVGDYVTIYANSTILGGATRLGEHSIIGANVTLLESIPPQSVAFNKNTGVTVRPRRSGEASAEAGDWVI